MLQSVVLPNSVPEAIAALSAPGSALLAGGTVLMPRVNAGDDAITTLVSLKRAGLTGVRVSAGSVEIGTATTLAELAEADALAFLRPALDAIASPTIRNMATVGGNLFAKQPYGDLGACLIALDAQVTIKGAGGTRTQPVAQVVAAPLAAGEIATAITFSLPAPDSFRFAKAGRKALNAAARTCSASNGRPISARSTETARSAWGPTPPRKRPTTSTRPTTLTPAPGIGRVLCGPV